MPGCPYDSAKEIGSFDATAHHFWQQKSAPSEFFPNRPEQAKSEDGQENRAESDQLFR